MKRKLFLAVIFLMSMVIFGNNTAFAGDKQRHRWEGFVLGAGAVIIGNAILNNMSDEQHVSVKVHHGDQDRPHEGAGNYNRDWDGRHEGYDHHPPRHGRDYHCKGHWEQRRIWNPPVFSNTWIPGHYNHRGFWIAGKWCKKIQTPGHWVIEKIWISHR